MQPLAFYQLAGSLLQQGAAAGDEQAAEATARCIASRAYYGAFLAARDRARITNRSGSVHEATIAHYRQLAGANNTGIANRLATLKLLRTRADYVLDAEFQRRDAGEALRLSRNILERLGLLN